MLAVSHLSKAFGSVIALRDVSTEFYPGEIHAILGENGAGKSTLVSIIAGFLKPSAGTLTVDSHPIPVGNPFATRSLGIEMIHQHFTLVPEFTVAENLALSSLPRLASTLDPTAVLQSTLEQAHELNWTIEPSAKVRDLPVGVQQRIEILKALVANAQVLILDEPTAVLSPEEVQDLFRVLSQLKARGKTIILIAHKLAEVMQIADRVTVLRQGRVVGQSIISEVDPKSLATMMVGELPNPHSRTGQSPGRPRVKAQGLVVLGDRGETAVENIAFQLSEGEIVGFGGVDGNGQVELAEALAGIRRVHSGQLDSEGLVAFIPPDRQVDGLALGMSIQDNVAVIAPRVPELSRQGFLRTDAIRKRATEIIQDYEIRAQGPNERAGSLSGGNQQKIVVGRVISLEPQILVVMNPTRGLDVRATAFVREKLLRERERGAAIALFTTDLDELYALSDRVFFLSKGRLITPSDAESYLGGSPS